MKFHGSITALVTPFKKGGIDEKALVRIVKHQIASGTDGLVPVGTTGESPTLSHEEHHRVIEIVVDAAAKKVPVIAGTGSNSTQEAVSLTRFAKKAGAQGALLAAPYYNKPTQEGLYRHYAAVAKSVDLPIVLYNIPGRSVVNISPETVARLSKISNIVAIKEASGSMDQTSHILSLCGIDVLSGDDSLTLPLLSLGAKGVISVLSNILPQAVSEMVDAYFAGDHDRARKAHYKMFPLCRAMFIETNPIPIKRSMQLLGFCDDALRLPLCEMNPGNEKILIKALKDYGLKIKG
jgi:4-hydroxy-tetrahydrodipicolinate synthase